MDLRFVGTDQRSGICNCLWTERSAGTATQPALHLRERVRRLRARPCDVFASAPCSRSIALAGDMMGQFEMDMGGPRGGGCPGRITSQGFKPVRNVRRMCACREGWLHTVHEAHAHTFTHKYTHSPSFSPSLPLSLALLTPTPPFRNSPSQIYTHTTDRYMPSYKSLL